jgi:hypothetical protein
MELEITIRNYKKKLKYDIVKKSQGCTVRECDEVNPGVFEAYVDELNRSYDVSVTVQKDLLIKHGCDCESSESICHHQVALFSFIAKGTVPVPRIKTVKKNDPLKQALEQADRALLLEWLHKTFKKQKELGLAFMNEFSTSSKLYSPAEIVTLTQDAVKAVINRRSKAEVIEVKKIVELWAVIHRPIIENFIAQPTNADFFNQLHVMIDTVYRYRYQIRTSSKRFESYLNQVIDQLTQMISDIHDDESWSICIGYFLSELISSHYGELRSEYINLIIGNFNSASSSKRAIIAQNLMKVYQSRKHDSVTASGQLLQFALRTVLANNQFAKYKDLFTPLKYANEYNLRVIDCLIEIGDLHQAEVFCLQQINQNTNSAYNFGYNVRLKEIYQESNNQAKLLPVLAGELLKEPDFENYKRVVSGTPNDTEFKKWRNLVLANARILARFDKKSADFSLALRHYEGNWQGLLAYVDENADYEIILKYSAELLDHLPELFIKKIIDKQDSQRDQILNEKDPARINAILEALFQISISKFGIEPLRLLIHERKGRFSSWVNFFVAYANQAYINISTEQVLKIRQTL